MLILLVHYALIYLSCPPEDYLTNIHKKFDTSNHKHCLAYAKARPNPYA